jgi:hypothetical protein
MEPVLPPDLEDVYDDDVLARIDRPVPAPAGDTEGPGFVPSDDGDGGTPAVAAEPLVLPRYPVARRLGVGGAMMAGALMGVAEVFEPERARQHIIDYVPDQLDEDQQLVTYHHVPGSPRASRIVLRPWLLERFRRDRA